MIKKNIKIILFVMGALITFWTFTVHFASSEGLKRVEDKMTAAIQEVKKSGELDRDIARFTYVTDSLVRARIIQRSRPTDKDNNEDVENLKAEKARLESQIKGK
jgi:Zn-dependent membrane protease YugP